MSGFFLQKKKAILARTIVLGLCLGFFSHARAADLSDFETEEYFKSTGLDIINASAAYSRGYTGKGVTVGISDAPVNFTSPEFSTKQHSYQADSFYPPYIDENGTEHHITDSNYWQFMDHGTPVAGIAAASRNGTGMHGVAYDGELVGSASVNSYSMRGGSSRLEWADAFLDDPAIKIVNCSWNAPEHPLEEVEENETIERYCKRTGLLENKRVTDILSPLGKNTLFVWTTGNYGYPMPALGYGLSHWAEGRAVATNVISVTALEDTKYLTKEEGSIRGLNILLWFCSGASFNEDGTLAAPGENIVSANADYVRSDEIAITASGTSVAAPHVAGAAALVQ